MAKRRYPEELGLTEKDEEELARGPARRSTLGDDVPASKNIKAAGRNINALLPLLGGLMGRNAVDERDDCR